MYEKFIIWVLWALIWWISTVSLQYHIFKKEIYFAKKEAAFKILQLIDILNYKLSLIFDSDTVNKEYINEFENKLNELKNTSGIYFPDFKQDIENILNLNTNFKKLICLSKALLIDWYDEKINTHNENVYNNLDKFQKSYNELLITFKNDFSRYLKKEERKLFFRFFI